MEDLFPAAPPLLTREVGRIVLTRLGSGRKIGFLPGDIQEK